MGIFITATVAMILLGLMFGAGLALASRVFQVQTDERTEQILEALPGTNCGACGYGGCMAYAQAVVNNAEKTNLCVPGGAETASQVAVIMGVEVQDAGLKKRAIVHCRGSVENCDLRCDYSGFENCKAAHLLSGGPKSCLYGCLGYGSCSDACPFDAITMEDGLPVIDPEKCTACGICVKTCPRNLISLLDMQYSTYLGCSTRDSGKSVKQTCKKGCISCGACAKKTPEDTIEMQDNLPIIHYENVEDDISYVAEICPMDCFVVQKSSSHSAST